MCVCESVSGRTSCVLSIIDFKRGEGEGEQEGRTIESHTLHVVICRRHRHSRTVPITSVKRLRSLLKEGSYANL